MSSTLATLTHSFASATVSLIHTRLTVYIDLSSLHCRPDGDLLQCSSAWEHSLSHEQPRASRNGSEVTMADTSAMVISSPDLTRAMQRILISTMQRILISASHPPHLIGGPRITCAPLISDTARDGAREKRRFQGFGLPSSFHDHSVFTTDLPVTCQLCRIASHPSQAARSRSIYCASFVIAVLPLLRASTTYCSVR